MATENFKQDYVFEDSDQEIASDSEDEIQTMLVGTLEQKRRIKRRSVGLPSDSSEDEFEKEMNAELSSAVSQSYPTLALSQQKSSEAAAKKRKEQQDENDKLLYDPHMDDEDQKWVDKQRKKYQPQNKKVKSVESKSLPKSDAVLNCPACMCAVCLDCQRHELYENQYRAMFVLNCLVDYGENLQFKNSKAAQKNKGRKRKAETGSRAVRSKFSELVTVDSQRDNVNDDDVDIYHPVTCSNCNTRVAVYDSDEVYHFFNVLTSHS